jgi:hypothetical protein
MLNESNTPQVANLRPFARLPMHPSTTGSVEYCTHSAGRGSLAPHLAAAVAQALQGAAHSGSVGLRSFTHAHSMLQVSGLRALATPQVRPCCRRRPTGVHKGGGEGWVGVQAPGVMVRMGQAHMRTACCRCRVEGLGDTAGQALLQAATTYRGTWVCVWWGGGWRGGWRGGVGPAGH